MFFHQPHNSIGNNTYNAVIYDDVMWKPHFHKNLEFIYVISGKVHCTAGEMSEVVSEGEFAFILSNEIHSLKSVGKSKCWVGVFSGDFVHAFEKKVQGKTGDGFVFRCEKSIEEFLKIHLINSTDQSVFMLKSCLYALCDEYRKNIRLSSRKDKSGMLMYAITDYISQNYKNKTSLSQMAKRLGYNYYYLSKCFHKIFDMSFPDFLNSYRLDVALELLTETDKDITDIALESGFQSIRNFNEFFKSRIGTTPNRYRKGNK